MTRDELESLSREELIDLVLRQAQRLTEFEQLMSEVRAELEKVRQERNEPPKPPPTSKNSSQPPSQDHKGNQPSDRPRRKHGRGSGHRKAERPWVADPDEIVELKPECCSACRCDLQAATAILESVLKVM